MYAVNQGCMSRSTITMAAMLCDFWVRVRVNVARLRRRAHDPTSNTASHGDQEKSSSWIPMRMVFRYFV